jgi:hypothetical protein
MAWVLLEGREPDVAAELAVGESLDLAVVDGPPTLPPHRRSVEPGALRDGSWRVGEEAGAFVAEMGVGLVHASIQGPHRTVSERLAALNRAVRREFDPTGRLNPGRDPLAA